MECAPSECDTYPSARRAYRYTPGTVTVLPTTKNNTSRASERDLERGHWEHNRSGMDKSGRVYWVGSRAKGKSHLAKHLMDNLPTGQEPAWLVFVPSDSPPSLPPSPYPVPWTQDVLNATTLDLILRRQQRMLQEKSEIPK
jgi:hypothetical protein